MNFLLTDVDRGRSIRPLSFKWKLVCGFGLSIESIDVDRFDEWKLKAEVNASTSFSRNFEDKLWTWAPISAVEISSAVASVIQYGICLLCYGAVSKGK